MSVSPFTFGSLIWILDSTDEYTIRCRYTHSLGLYVRAFLFNLLTTFVCACEVRRGEDVTEGKSLLLMMKGRSAKV